MPALIVFCTCPDEGSAGALSQALVERRLAACVTRLPGAVSVYRWQDAIERGNEVLLLIKTTSDRFTALRDAVVSLHPYELPELIAVEAVAGLDRYLNWIGESTSPLPDA